DICTIIDAPSCVAAGVPMCRNFGCDSRPVGSLACEVYSGSEKALFWEASGDSVQGHSWIADVVVD
ncbi:MAG: hypothetical protein VCB42_01140, partial [Myxococcota bacterium]